MLTALDPAPDGEARGAPRRASGATARAEVARLEAECGRFLDSRIQLALVQGEQGETFAARLSSPQSAAAAACRVGAGQSPVWVPRQAFRLEAGLDVLEPHALHLQALFLFGSRTRPAAGARFRHDAEADLDSPATGVHKSLDGAVAGWEEVRGSSEDTVEGEDEDDENLEPEFSPPDS